MWATSDPVSRPARAGFTLIELLVVLTIVAALLLLAIPRLGGGQTLLQGQRQAREVGAQLSQARSMAITRQLPITVALSATAVESAPERRYSLGSRWQLRRPDGEQIAPDQPVLIRFFPDGSSSGGSVQLSDGERHFRLAVEWLTGRVRIDAQQPG